MEFQKVIEERRSIRRYDGEKKVSKEQIEEMIRCASLAPSWKNSQTGRYYCILSEEKQSEFREKCLPEFNGKNAENAAIIVTTFVRDRSGYEKDGTPSTEAGNGWGFYDLGLQNENLVLKAKDLGLDTLIMGIRNVEKVREFFKIPEEEIVGAVIAVGYAAKEASMPERKTIDQIAKFL